MTPLTYAVASASKRIFVIAISLLVLGNPVTWVNMFGMLLAIIGVLCYNRVSRSRSMEIRFDTNFGKSFAANLINFRLFLSFVPCVLIAHTVWLQAKHISRSTAKTVLPSYFHSDARRGETATQYKQLHNEYNNNLLARNGALKNGSVTNLLLNGSESRFTVNPNNKLLFV